MTRPPFASFFLLAVILAAGDVSAATVPDAPGAQEPAVPDQSIPTTSPSQNDLLLQTIREDESYAAQIRTRLAGGAADLPRIQVDLNRANARAEAQRTAIEPVSARYATAQAKLDTARGQARAELESRADFRAAAIAAETAASERHAAEEDSTRLLARTSAYRKLEPDINRARARVDYFRRAGPAFVKELNVASQMDQDVSGRQNQLKEQFLGSDPEVRKARERSATADAAVAAIRADNERKVAAVPNVIAAAEALQVEQGPYDTAMALVHAAEGRVTAIQLAYRQTVEGMAADRVTLAEIEEELTGFRAALALSTSSIDGIGLTTSGASVVSDTGPQPDAFGSAEAQMPAPPGILDSGAFPPIIGSAYLRTFPGRSFGLPRQGQFNGSRSAEPRQHRSRSRNSIPQQTPQPMGNDVQPQAQGRFSGRARR